MTYKQAQDIIFNKLIELGWTVSNPDLKIRWARRNTLEKKVWFKPQSLHTGYLRPDTSMHADVKDIAKMNLEQLKGFLSVMGV